MSSIFRNSLLVLALVNWAACSSGMQVPTDDDMRASYNPSVETTSMTSGEELDTEVRAEVLEKIQRHLLRSGEFPKSAIEKTELLSLTPTFTSQAPENSTWNYRALVRVNLKNTSVKIQFLTFDRDGELIVRKISV